MFGSDDNDLQKPAIDGSGALGAAMPDPINGPISPSASAVNSVFGSATGAPEVPDSTDNPNPGGLSTTTEPVLPEHTPDLAPLDLQTQPMADDSTPIIADIESDSSDDLIGLKQQALQQLSPLVSHLEQTPEEKFRTTMMMIQASDDKSLIKSAFEAAQKITDDKARAQALLDVINEINYFTQRSNNS